MATAATNAADDAICATAKKFFIVLLPRTGLSGTTTVSPGPIVDESTLPDQKPPSFPLETEPSARTIRSRLYLQALLALPRGRDTNQHFFPAYRSARLSCT